MRATSSAAAESLFTPRGEGTRIDHLVAQLLWVVSQSLEGGFFITIGRKL